MILSFHPCITGDVQIILGDKKLDREDLDLINNAEAIILPQGCSSNLFSACRDSNALLFPNYELRFSYEGKAKQVSLFKRFSIPHPRTEVWNSVYEFRCALLNYGLVHEFPFFIKRNLSHEGEGVFYIIDLRILSDVLDYMEAFGNGEEGLFISQDAVDCGGNVLRAVIIGSRIFTYWKRPIRKENPITTLSKGARVDKDWMPELQRKARDMVRQFQALTSINLAAVDMVFSKQEETPLFLEINYYFGRRGLAGSARFYELLFEAVVEWLNTNGIDPAPVKLVV